VNTQTFSRGLHLSISLGASTFQEGDTPASFVERADAAMYTAKRSGRNRVALQG
jgi:PleD family two-component response regulator